MKRSYLYIIAIVIAILIGVIVFASVSNRSLRREIREAKRENKVLQGMNKLLHEKNDSLYAELEVSQSQISEGTAIYDSLKTTLEYLNNKKIITVNENIRTVTTLDLNEHIRLLAGFIEGADSAR